MVNLGTAYNSLCGIRDLFGAEVLAGVLVSNGDALEDHGEEGGRPVQGGRARCAWRAM